MQPHRQCARTWPRFALAGLGVLAILLSAQLYAWAVEPSDIVRVEEDWELVVGSPEPTATAPQVTCVISPVGDLDSWHAAVELNHQTLPEFAAGGVTLQAWQGEDPGVAVRQKFGSVLNHDDEHVTWTQSMELADGQLTFQIAGGDSATWGSFGGGENLRVVVNSSLENLNDYRPEVSAASSGVGFASNRVQRLELKKVRVVRANGEVQEVNAALTVHELE